MREPLHRLLVTFGLPVSKPGAYLVAYAEGRAICFVTKKLETITKSWKTLPPAAIRNWVRRDVSSHLFITRASANPVAG